MIEYLIVCIAFAIMVHFRFIHEVLCIVKDLRFHLDIENEPTNWSPIIFSLVFFIINTVLMPFMILYIFMVERKEILKDISGAVIKSYFQLEEK